MQPHIEAMVKSLVAVAWADGRLHKHEAQLLDALLVAFELESDSADALRAYAAQSRGLGDIPLQDLSADDRRLLLQHAVLLTYVDGEQSTEERELLHVLTRQLRIPDAEAQPLLARAERRALRLRALLT